MSIDETTQPTWPTIPQLVLTYPPISHSDTNQLQALVDQCFARLFTNTYVPWTFKSALLKVRVEVATYHEQGYCGTPTGAHHFINKICRLLVVDLLHLLSGKSEAYNRTGDPQQLLSVRMQTCAVEESNIPPTDPVHHPTAYLGVLFHSVNMVTDLLNKLQGLAAWEVVVHHEYTETLENKGKEAEHLANIAGGDQLLCFNACCELVNEVTTAQHTFIALAEKCLARLTTPGLITSLPAADSV